MVSTTNQLERREFVEISRIKITLRMRRTDEDRIRDLAESIKGIGLLHPVSLAEKDGDYILLAGFHRIGGYKLLGYTEIPATARESDELVDQLITCEENLVRSELNAIQTAEHIVMREQLLIALGRKTVVESNQYSESKITNEELAKQMGFTRRTYQYKRSVANLNEEAKDLLCETKFAENLMDMVKLQKEPDHIQIEVAKLLASCETKTFRRAWVVAHMKHKQDRWTSEVKSRKAEIGIPMLKRAIYALSEKINHMFVYIYLAETTQVRLLRNKLRKVSSCSSPGKGIGGYRCLRTFEMKLI